MHEDDYDDVVLEDDESDKSLKSLKQICLRVVSGHIDALGMNALELPTSVLKELLHHLNIIDLERLQLALNLKGISTHSAWMRILQDIKGPQNVGDLHREEDSKQKVMETLFQVMFYDCVTYGGIAKYIPRDDDANALLMVMAKYIKHFLLRPSRFLRSLISEQRPLLDILEKTVKCVDIKKPITYLFTWEPCYMLYTLHRIMDHGEANELIVSDLDSALLPWILHRRGSQHEPSQRQVKAIHKGRACSIFSSAMGTTRVRLDSIDEDEDHAAPHKRRKLEFVSKVQKPGASKLMCRCLYPEVLCKALSLSAGPRSEPCPQGRIESLQLMKCEHNDLRVLLPFLPTWLCLHTLVLESETEFSVEDVLALASALKQLCESPNNAFTDLTLGVLPHDSLVDPLLGSCPNLKSLSVKIDPEHFYPPEPANTVQSGSISDLALEKLSVRVPHAVINIDSIISVLKRSQNLTSLHLSGIWLPLWLAHANLLTTITESNRCLKRLYLEDLNLAACQTDILSFLKSCMLEELSLKDCRLLEKCSDKESFLRQLVDSLKMVPSLHSLNLSQNRLAQNVPLLAELFQGSYPSTIKELDISANYIQPQPLLEFARLLKKHHLPQRVALDLRKNPWDQDQQVWDTALVTLHPICDFLTDKWKSRDMMADHISNM